jgi:hypothetical protein
MRIAGIHRFDAPCSTHKTSLQILHWKASDYNRIAQKLKGPQAKPAKAPKAEPSKEDAEKARRAAIKQGKLDWLSQHREKSLNWRKNIRVKKGGRSMETADGGSF